MARLAYLGTPDMAVPPLQALVEAGHEIVCCITRPDKKRGRGGALTPSPVAQAAHELGLPVSHTMDDVATSGAELAVVVAYGRIIPASLLAQVPMVNVHFSLLPRWRGAAPVERALLAGDVETGVCIMKVEEGLDTGAVYARRSIPITPDLNLEALRSRLVEVGSALLIETLAHGVAGLPTPEPQEGTPTTAEKLTTSDLHLQWSDAADRLLRVVRLGRAWTTFRGKRLMVLQAAGNDAPPDTQALPGTLIGITVQAGTGVVQLIQVQPESKAPMAAEDWVRGVRLAVGERLGTD
jgi:methionyl-tRNA formyltransferase